MREQRPNDPLDRLIRAHPPQGPAPWLATRVMARVRDKTIAPPAWQTPWLQRLAAGVGLALALTKLVTYVLSAWIVVEIAG